MKIRYNKTTGYIFMFYWQFKVVYIGMGRTFDWRSMNKLDGSKFDSVNIEEVDLGEMEKRKRSLILEYKPVYNKFEERKKKAVIPVVRVVGIHKGSSLAEKLKYCGDNNISMQELNDKIKKGEL